MCKLGEKEISCEKTFIYEQHRSRQQHEQHINAGAGLCSGNSSAMLTADHFRRDFVDMWMRNNIALNKVEGMRDFFRNFIEKELPSETSRRSLVSELANDYLSKLSSELVYKKDCIVIYEATGQKKKLVQMFLKVVRANRYQTCCNQRC